MNGRLPAGQSSTRATHHPAAAISATPPAVSRPSRCPTRPRPWTAYVAARAGRTRNASSIFVRNPSPDRVPASTSHQTARSLSSARSVAYAAPSTSAVSIASGLL